MCLFSWSWYTCGFSTRCHVAGCPSGVPLLAVHFRVAGRTGSAPLPPLVLVVVCASGVLVGEGSFFRTFGFPEVGTFSFPAPFRRLSVPPLAGLEGQGCGALGCRGAAGGLLSALPQHSSSFQCSHPNAFFQPPLHHGGCSGGGHLGLHCQGCCGASSTPFSRLLQPSVRSVEDLGVMASGHRPLPIPSLCGRVSLPDGDHSVCAPVGASGGLDGLHHSDGSVPSSASSSSFSSLSSLHVPRHCLSFQSAVLWPLPCSAGLHQGHGSCFCYTPFSGGPYETVSQRLARPVTLSGVPPRGSSDCPPTLSRVGDCGQPPAIQPGSITGGSVSGGCHRLRLFQGFSVGGAHLPAAVNSLRVSVLRLAYRALMAIATRRPFFAGSPRSWRQTEDAVPPALPPSFLGSSGSGSSGVYVDGVSSQHPVVTPSPSSISRSVSLPGVSRLTLLVSRLRRGVGCPSRSSDRFGPVGRPTGGVILNARELLAVNLGLHQFQSSLQGRTVAVFCATTTAVACLRKEGGTRSPLLNTLAQEILRWTGSLFVHLAPQFLPGSNNVLADALSRPHQLPHSGWLLNLTVFHSLRSLWSVQIDLFANSDDHCCSISFSPFRDPMSAGMDAFLLSWDGLQAYAFPPVAILPRVLA